MTTFEKISKKEIIELDHKLNVCARAAMSTYMGNPVNMQIIPARINASLKHELEILDLYKAPFVRLYKQRFPEEDNEVIVNEIWTNLYQEFQDTICQIKVSLREKSEFSLLFPIMFYTFVCNNCLNPNTTARKNSRKKECEQEENKESKENKENKENKEIKKSEGKIGAYYHSRKLCEITRKSLGLRSERKTTYETSGKRLLSYINDTVEKLQQEIGYTEYTAEKICNMSPFKLAVLALKNSYAIYLYQDSAQRGLFFRELLDVSRTENKQLDTILRMVIANEMDSLLVRTGILNALYGYVFLDFKTPTSLLKWYYEFLHPEETSAYIVDSTSYLEEFICKAEEHIRQESQCGPSEKSVDNKGNVSKTDTDKTNFIDIYNELKDTFPLSLNDANNICDFYLSKKELDEALSAWASAKKLFSFLYDYIRGKHNGNTLPSYRHRMILAKIIRGWTYEEVANTVYVTMESLRSNKN